MAYNKTACFIDALNLGEDCEPGALLDGDHKLIMESEVVAEGNKNINEEKDSNLDSLETSKIPSPSSQNKNLPGPHIPMSWFVEIKSVEERPQLDETEKSSKKNMFNMFVELAQPDEKQKKVFDARPPVDRKSLNCVKKKLFDAWSSNSDMKESGFVSDHQEEKIRPDITYPSLNINSSGSTFVKLSDMDKAPKLEQKERAKQSMLLTKSIPENSSVKQISAARISRSTGFIPIYAENAKSLSRIFPSLSNEYFLGMPGLVSSSRSATPSEIEEITSEISDTSTQTIASSTDVVLDSFGFIQNTNQNRLGEDLLRMFEKEIVTDVTIEFAGRRVGAHKCILASRCPHFASLLSGGWVESAGNSISLDGYSYATVIFTLRYIYSGASVLPENINLNEITSLADKLGLEGLKEVITLTIKDKYCHNFHEPCGLCTLGVLECLPICLTYGLDEVYQRSLYWLTEYFVEIWPTEAFGSMSTDIIDRVCHQHKVDMTPDNVVATVSGLREIGLSLPSVRWAEPVKRACNSLLKASENFTSIHLAAVLKSVLENRTSTVCLSQDIVEGMIEVAIRTAPIVQLCRTYGYLSNISVGHHLVGQSMRELRVVDKWRRECEDVLVHAPAYVALEPEFQALPEHLQARLCKRGNPRLLETNSGTPTRNSTPKSTSGTAFVARTASKLFARIYTSFTPYSSKPAVPSNMTYKVKDVRTVTSLRKLPTQPPTIRTTLAQTKREQFNKQIEEKKTKSVKKHPKPKVTPITTNNNRKYQPITTLPKSDRYSSDSSRKSSPLFTKTFTGNSRNHHQSSSNTKTASCSVPLAQNDNTVPKEENKKAVENGNIDVTEINAPEKPAVQRKRNVSRIPVYIGVRKVTSSSPSLSDPVSAKLSNDTRIAARGRKVSARMGSLMCPTKSSAAKIVSKKTPTTSKANASQCSGQSSGSLLQRSTTFIKEEPCFPGSPDISSNQ